MLLLTAFKSLRHYTSRALRRRASRDISLNVSKVYQQQAYLQCFDVDEATYKSVFRLFGASQTTTCV